MSSCDTSMCLVVVRSLAKSVSNSDERGATPECMHALQQQPPCHRKGGKGVYETRIHGMVHARRSQSSRPEQKVFSFAFIPRPNPGNVAPLLIRTSSVAAATTLSLLDTEE